MSNLQSRLELALEKSGLTQSELAKGVGITAAGMSKLLNGKSKELKAAHAFKIARLCKVDAEWLATGRGRPDSHLVEKTTKVGIEQEFEQKHIDLLRMYRRLPREIRYDVRNLIQTLAAAGREDYVTWIRSSHELAKETEET